MQYCFSPQVSCLPQPLAEIQFPKVLRNRRTRLVLKKNYDTVARTNNFN